MATAVEKLADDLNLSPDDLLERSIDAFLERELRLVQMDIADFQDRYSVKTTAELEGKIERGEIHSHPAWEELIEWQNLESYRDRLDYWQHQLD